MDLDGTLISISSEKFFLKRLLRKRILSPYGFLRFLLSYVLHPLITVREGKGWNRTYLEGIAPEIVETEAIELSKELVRSKLRSRTVQLVLELNEAGSVIVLLSASLEYIAEAVAEELPVDLVYASTPEIMNNRFTGKLSGLRPWGRSKAELLRRICEREGVNPLHCIAIGDSWADRFIMNQSGSAVAICPDARLRKLAESSGWEILEGTHTRWA